MEALIYLDTHVAVWLFAGLRSRLTGDAAQQIEANELRISPIVLLELQYLNEIGRIAVTPERVRRDLERRIGLSVCDRSFENVIQVALAQTWTRDPFDRMIVGQASLEQNLLITKDATIRAHYPRATW